MIVNVELGDALEIVNAVCGGEGIRVKLFADETGIGFVFRKGHPDGGYNLGRVTFSTDEALDKLAAWAAENNESSTLAETCFALRSGFAVWQLLKRGGAV